MINYLSWTKYADQNNWPIIIDNESGTIKAGFAGDKLPSTEFPSIVGRPKTEIIIGHHLSMDLVVLMGYNNGEIYVMHINVHYWSIELDNWTWGI